jgi:hypothetical protein
MKIYNNKTVRNDIANNHQGVPGTGVLETGLDFSAALSSSLNSSSLLAG